MLLPELFSFIIASAEICWYLTAGGRGKLAMEHTPARTSWAEHGDERHASALLLVCSSSADRLSMSSLKNFYKQSGKQLTHNKIFYFHTGERRLICNFISTELKQPTDSQCNHSLLLTFRCTNTKHDSRSVVGYNRPVTVHSCQSD